MRVWFCSHTTQRVRVAPKSWRILGAFPSSLPCLGGRREVSFHSSLDASGHVGAQWLFWCLSFSQVSELPGVPQEDCQASCLLSSDVKRRDYTFGLHNQDSVLRLGLGLPHLKFLGSVCGYRCGALGEGTKAFCPFWL